MIKLKVANRISSRQLKRVWCLLVAFGIVSNIILDIASGQHGDYFVSFVLIVLLLDRYDELKKH